MVVCSNCGHPAFSKTINNKFMKLHGIDNDCIPCRKKWAIKCPVMGCNCENPAPVKTI